MYIVPYLSKHVADERFVKARISLDELKQVQAITVLLHDHLEEVLILIGL